MIVASDLSDSTEDNANIISDYNVDNFIEHIQKDTLNNLYLFRKQKAFGD